VQGDGFSCDLGGGFCRGSRLILKVGNVTARERAMIVPQGNEGDKS
jgi:hypothetical protein